MTISPQTRTHYLDLNKSLRNRHNHHPDIPFLDWLRDILAPSVTRSTWRLYRSALIQTSTDPQEISDLQALSTALSQPRPRAKTPGLKTSSQRTRHFRSGEVAKILSALFHSRSLLDKHLGNLLSATILVGLRPVEWKSAYLSDLDDVPVLVVQSAKVRESTGSPTRTLLLDKLAPIEIESIRLALKFSTSQPWPELYELLRRRMRAVVQRVLANSTRNPTLYTARHQFAADLKAAGRTMREIAALMGHASTQTAVREYGQGRAGSARRGGVRATAEEIEGVLDTHNLRPKPAPTPTPDLVVIEHVFRHTRDQFGPVQ